MTTARDICNLALKQVGVLGVGQTALPEDINDAFTYLGNMVAQWQKSRWLVPSLQKLSFTCDGSVSYTVGIGGDINIQRPSDIKAAYVVQLNTGSNPISLPLRKLFSYEDYALIAVKSLPSLPDRFFYDGQFPLANFFPFPIPSSQYQITIVFESLLGFGTTIETGSITTGGAAYTNGNYENVELAGGSGTGATADITVTGGAVAVVSLLTGGENYAIGDILSATAADIGGTGAGFTWTVGNIQSNVDTEIVMPPEYKECLIMNLTLRLSAVYQIPSNDDTRRLAKTSLNTLRKNNTQIPALTMPARPGLRTGIGFNLYNPDGY